MKLMVASMKAHGDTSELGTVASEAETRASLLRWCAHEPSWMHERTSAARVRAKDANLLVSEACVLAWEVTVPPWEACGLASLVCP
jgi:hypothetical protein